MFAIQTLDETYGYIEVLYVKWPSETGKEKKILEMIPCEEYMQLQKDLGYTGISEI